MSLNNWEAFVQDSTMLHIERVYDECAVLEAVLTIPGGLIDRPYFRDQIIRLLLNLVKFYLEKCSWLINSLVIQTAKLFC